MRQSNRHLSSTRRRAKTYVMSLWQALLTLVGIASAIGLVGMIARWLRGESMLRGFALGFGATIGVLALIVFYKIARARVQRALLRNENRDSTPGRCVGMRGLLRARAYRSYGISSPNNESSERTPSWEFARISIACFRANRICNSMGCLSSIRTGMIRLGR